MSRVLLDTHALLWAVAEPRRLSGRVADLLADESTDPVVSAASAWEIATKHRLGRLPRAEALLDNWHEALTRLKAQPIPVTHPEALRAGRYRCAHRDPFDRLLAAQAEYAGITLISSDPAFAQFPIVALW